MQFIQHLSSFSGCLGPILDVSGYIYTSAVIGDLNVWKNGATTALASPSTLAHTHNGYYLYTGWSGDSNVLGRMDISCNKTDYAMPQKTFQVLPSSTFDTVALNSAGLLNGLVVAGANGGVRLSSQGVTDVASGVWTANPSHYSGVDQFGRELQPIYYADIKQYYDFTNTRDEYAVDWYRGNQTLNSGSITNAAISVYNTSTGATVFENGVMSYGYNIGGLRYNDASNLLTAGEPYQVMVSGTIDGSTRVWQRIIGRNKLS